MGVCPNPVYVADPTNGFSKHSRGNTVDISLVSTNGDPVEMPSDFDDFTSRAPTAITATYRKPRGRTPDISKRS